MRFFDRLATGVDVEPILAEIDAHPAMWDLYPQRRSYEGSPHAEVSDAWLRYSPIENGEPGPFRGPATMVWYPAATRLPSLLDFIAEMVSRFEPSWLGGVLLTRIPPDAAVKPHNDRGGAHAEAYPFKLFLSLRANEGCINRGWAYDGEQPQEVTMRPGEVWTYSNTLPHAVENRGATERIMAIICMAR